MVLFAATTPSQATLLSFSGVSGANSAAITTTPPNPVVKDPNDGILLAWNEVQNFQLLSVLRVDRVADPNAPFIAPDGSGFIIKAGTIVSSHYLQWDPGAGSSNTVNATIHFDSDIFAFIIADQKMFDSDAPLGLPNLDYNDFTARGLEAGDTTTINGDEVTIRWTATSPGDWTRLITAFSPAAAIPELTTNSDPENPTIVDIGNVRVGTTGSANLVVANTGDFGSILSGVLPGASAEFTPITTQAFGPLGQSESNSRTYNYTPTARGADQLALADITSQDDPDNDAPVTLEGVGVGPVFDSNPLPDSSLDFGSLPLNDSAVLSISISNITTDGDLGGLTDLTLNDIAISGLGASQFEMVGFSNGSTISESDSLVLDVRFNSGAAIGFFDATLTIHTDEGVALGGNGADYDYILEAETTPEPATLMLMGMGGLAIIRRRFHE